VVFEPDGNIPPKFLENSIFAIEVRRLNQHFSNNVNPKGLEQVSLSIFPAIEDVLRSFDSQYQGKSYSVTTIFKRPLNANMRLKKKE
jgi:hypothetical protein